MKKAKKLIVTLLAACMMIAGASVSAFAMGTDSLVKFTPARLDGATRYQTSFMIADALKDTLGVDAFDNIIVAYGGNYPDALSGGYLAKVKNAPVIIVDKKTTSENDVVKYIQNNLKEDGTVYILGDVGVVTRRFENAVKSFASVERIAGATRYATNIEILKAAKVTDEELIICTGNGYADSLSASAVGRPILLVNKTLTAEQKALVSKAKKAYLIGGSDVVSTTIEKQVKALNSNTKRIAGATRYSTSTLVAQEFFGDDIEAITLAYGKNFPDGLSGGPLAMALDAPLVLTEKANYKDAKAYREGTDAYLCMTLGSTDLISDAAVFDIMYNYITTKELKADASNYVVVDVRKLADFEASHIRGSVSADVDAAVAASDNTNATAIANIKKIVDANDADTKYVLVCYSGNKYARAATTIMAELGVDPANILTLKGGFAQWTKDYPTDVVFEYQYVNADDVFAALTDKDVVILDSRKAADYKTAHIPGAVNADCDSIVSNNEEEPATTNIANVVTKYGTDKTYFVVCYSGNRYAKAATDILESKGVNKDNIHTLGGDNRAVSSNGGMKAWNAKYPNYVVKSYTSTGGYDFMNGITAANLKVDVEGKKVFTVVDLRTADLYSAGHIPGAVSAVQRDVTADEAKANLQTMLTKNPDGKYVLVCYTGNKFANQARNTLVNELGVDEKDVIVLEGGQSAWTGSTEKGNGNYVNADDVFGAINKQDVVLLDTRKAADYKTAHIPGAVNADCDSVVSNNEEEPAKANVNAVVDKYGVDKKYYVICYSGNRYAQAATEFLIAKGVNTNNVYTLGGDDRKISSSGGMKAWNAKYPNYVVKTYTSTGGFNFMNGITAANLKVDVEGKKVFTVVDLRTADLYKAGHIPGAVSAVQRDVTADEAKANLQTMLTKNPNGKYVLVCYTGNKFANQARNTLVNELGVDEKDVIILEGGQNAWTGQTVATE